jgi:hypothetical protein
MGKDYKKYAMKSSREPILKSFIKLSTYKVSTKLFSDFHKFIIQIQKSHRPNEA